MADVQYLRSLLGVHPDFPKKGITFLDLFPILRDPVAFETLITHMVHHITSHTIPKLESKKIDTIVGLDARGFLLGPIIALRLNAAFVPVRKKGKLPGKCTTAVYEKEYGSDSFDMQEGAIAPGSNVLVIDDLIATGGSAKAAGELVAKQGGKTVEYMFVVGLTFLKGHEKLDAPAYSIIEAED
ncbi:adenine phosphoribosyltransferase [Ceratobasidium sp. AG-Ba]|nr:adenine phosphoribosyltransferase [Ceratobasidium sp. AG-Ba]QRW05175.1 adenine phosphoribosyltransferase [Ceratobasidium sp. AG-Ba]